MSFALCNSLAEACIHNLVEHCIASDSLMRVLRWRFSFPVFIRVLVLFVVNFNQQCYKTIGSRFHRAYIELWMHLGSLESMNQLLIKQRRLTKIDPEYKYCEKFYIIGNILCEPLLFSCNIWCIRSSFHETRNTCLCLNSHQYSSNAYRVFQKFVPSFFKLVFHLSWHSGHHSFSKKLLSFSYFLSFKVIQYLKKHISKIVIFAPKCARLRQRVLL